MATLRLGIDASGSRDGAAVYTSSINKIKAESRGAVSSTDQVTGSFDKMKAAAFSLQKVLLTLGAGIAIKNIVSDFAAFEKGLIGIGKTTNMVGDDLKAVGDNLKNMDISVPLSELLSIGQAAGQLGVSGVDNITKFTETVAGLSIATSDFKGDEAASTLARLLTITRTGVGDVDRLASSIVAIGNNFAATEGEIAEVAIRVAQSTAMFGVSVAEVVGLSGAMKQVGVQAEAGGTVILQAFQAINGAVRKGGEEFALLEKLTGKTGQALRDMFKDTPMDTFQLFLEGLGKASKAGADLTGILEVFGLSGARAVPVLASLGKNADTVAQAVKLSTEEYEKNTAATKEVQTASESLSAHFEMMSKAAVKVNIAIGEAFSEELKNSADATARALDSLVENLDEVGDAAVVLALAVGGKVVGALTASSAAYVQNTLASIANARQIVSNTAATLAGAEAKVADVTATRAVIAAAREEAMAKLAAANASTAHARAHLAAVKLADTAAMKMRMVKQATLELTAAERARSVAMTQLAVLGQQNARTVGQLAAASTAATAAHTAHAAALLRVNIAARAGALAMGGLKAAMAFLGGPIGLIFTALAAGLYLYSQRAEDAADSSETLKDTIKGLTTSAKELQEVKFDTAIADIGLEMQGISKKIQEHQEKLKEIAKSDTVSIMFQNEMEQIQNLGKAYGQWAADLEKVKTAKEEFIKGATVEPEEEPLGDLGTVEDKYGDLKKSLDIQIRQSQELVNSLKNGGDAYKYISAQIEAENMLIQEGIKYGKSEIDLLAKKILLNDELTDTFARAAKEKEEIKKYEKSVKDLQAENEMTKRLIAAYGQSAEAIKAVNLEIAIQNALKSANIKAGEEESKALEEAIREQARLAQSLGEVQSKYKEATDGTKEIFKKAAEGIYDSFATTFRKIFDDGINGFDDFADDILNIFKDMLAQMMVLAIAKPIIIPVVQQLGGFMGLSGADINSVTSQLGGGTTGEQLASGNGMSMPTSGIGKMAQAGGGYGGALMGAAGGAFYGYQQGGTRGAVIGGVAGYAGGAALTAGAGALAAGWGGAASGGAALAGASSALAAIPVWGWAALAALAIFGSGKAKPSNKSAWGAIDLMSGETSSFGNQQGKKFSQETVDARDNFFQAISAVSTALKESTGGTLVGTVRADIGQRDGTQVTGTLLGNRKFADPQSAMSEIFRAMTNSIQGISAEWSTVFAKLDFSDLEKSVAQLQDAAFIINKDFIQPEPLNEAAQALKNVSDAFNPIIEKARELGLSTVAVYAEMNKQLNKIKTDFTQSIADQILAIVDPMQYALDNFDKTARERIANASALGLELTAVERLNLLQRNQIIEQYQSQANQLLQQANNSIEQYLTRLTSGSDSPYNPQTVYSNAQARFADLLSEATNGNEEARSAIVDAANNFITASKEQNGANASFFEDLNTVTDALYSLLSDGVNTTSTLKSIGAAITRGNADIISQFEELNDLVESLRDTVATQQTTIDRLLSA